MARDIPAKIQNEKNKATYQIHASMLEGMM